MTIQEKIQLAESKLNHHKDLGARSNLNVVEVAKIMDSIIEGNKKMTAIQNNTIFFELPMAS